MLNEGFKSYRSKPVVIKAMRFMGHDSATEIIRMTTGIREEKGIDSQGNLIPILLVDTLEGTMQATLGDWIIIGTQGEAYPCKNEVFEVKYEEVTAEIPQ